MRLKTRLLLSFVLLALVPIAIVVPTARAQLRSTLERELEQRMQAAETATNADIVQRRRDVRETMDRLSDSEAMERFVKEFHANLTPSRLSATAQQLIRIRLLSVLSVLDEKGVTVLSGHLPARRGDPDPDLFAVTKLQDPEPQVVLVEVRGDAGLQKMPALVTARPVEYGALKLWVVGGVLLDKSVADHLADLTGTRVDIASAGASYATGGKALPPLIERAVPLAPSSEVTITLALSRATVAEAERVVLKAVLVFAALGVFLALVLALWQSLVITRPVEALTEGARRVAAGDLGAKVEANAQGEVGALVETFNRMTSDLRRTTDNLVAAERVAAWQEVARRLAHEIKNPLTPIRMSLETLQAASAENNPRFPSLFKESAAVVLEEVDRLKRIVDEFTRFARLPKPQLQDLDLEDLVKQVLTLYAAPPPGITLEPALEPGLKAQGDRDQLTQVLVNLVKNAQEAMPGGGKIWVRARSRDGQAVIEVEDTGPGVKPEDRARIFEPYFTTKGAGTGLGLAIAARVCQEHGGMLEVDGEPGKGAIFRVTIPRQAAAATAA
ncbi:MAG TPA: ATP-binding protein [Myxococcaceae bacterium]|nr:ATP-binding protein [Myxococcaceae bacterium]